MASKIFEALVNKAFFEFLECRNLLLDMQHDLRHSASVLQMRSYTCNIAIFISLSFTL